MPRGRRRTVRAAQYWPYATKRALDAARRTASGAVREALRTGALAKKPCERCARPPRRGCRPVEAHHEDYAKPLDVVWLCRRHHRERHREIGAQLPSPEFIAASVARERRQVLAGCRTTQPSILKVTEQVLDLMDGECVAQNELAGRMGVSRQAINGYFNGGIRTLKALSAVCDAIGYDFQVLFTKRRKLEAKAS